jgi:hypothetical protein
MKNYPIIIEIKGKKMKKMDTTALEQQMQEVTLKMMRMNLIRGSEEHIKLREELHRLNAIKKQNM